MREKKSKDKYLSAELEVVLLKANDLITTSSVYGDDDVANDDWT